MKIEMDSVRENVKQVIDAKGLICPAPLILTKKGLLSLEKGERLKVIVDNSTAVSNIERFAEGNNASTECTGGNGVYTLTITKLKTDIKVKNRENECRIFPPRGKHVFVFKNESLASDELGYMLTKGFFETIKEMTPLPDKIIFYHKGVNLVLEGSPCLEDIRELESIGVEILICGNCVEYYDVKTNVGAGIISNSYDILMALSNAHHVITP